MEYAELKEMPTQSLLAYHCHYNRQSQIYMEYAKSVNNVSGNIANDAMQDASKCLDEASKILSVLLRRSDITTLECKPK